MSVMLFKLRGVEDDEAGEIRQLLRENEIDFYETTNGRWGLGYAAIWLHDEERLDAAKRLISAYQQQRFEQARESYAQLCLDGQQPTIWSTLRERPVQVVAVFVAIVIIAMLALLPFVFF